MRLFLQTRFYNRRKSRCQLPHRRDRFSHLAVSHDDKVSLGLFHKVAFRRRYDRFLIAIRVVACVEKAILYQHSRLHDSGVAAIAVRAVVR